MKPETINLPRNGSAPSGEFTVHVHAPGGIDLDRLAIARLTLKASLLNGAVHVQGWDPVRITRR